MFDIANMPLFAGLGERELGEIQALGTGIRLSPGTSVGRQGGPVRECVLVCSGTIAIEQDGRTVAAAGPGAVFDDIAVLNGSASTHAVSGRTVTECDVLVFTRGGFRRMCELAPAVVQHVERSAIARLHEQLQVRMGTPALVS